MRGLQDKVVVAAGAGSGPGAGGGIGAASAVRLAQEGAKVVVGDLGLARAQATVDTITAAGGDAVAVAYDQGDWDSVQSLVAAATEHYGQIDGMFANAIDGRTVMRDTDAVDVELEVWDSMIRVGLTGYFYLVRAALPPMLEQGRGAIVCTSSDASTIGEAGRVAYGAGKAGVNALVRHVATRYGRNGIRANGIRPIALTPEVLQHMPQETVEEMVADNRSGRIGLPDDIAPMVAFLFSDDAGYVNGQLIGVNGGHTFTQ